MIQRVQTLYLLAACILCVVCLCLPIGHYITDESERVANIYNLCFCYTPQFIVDGMTGHNFKPWAMFAVLVIVAGLSLFNIMLFRRRATQMRICTFSMILLVAWYVLYVAFVYIIAQGLEAHFRPDWTAALPFCSLIFLYLAFRGIMKDEMLVKSLDRLR